ncbi:hypothetical protein F4778DRAFT_667606 [Xylariomycetidae sp. FL2044]|nr:hypothetical protein F4778DRAFT_667606 [Xylariomycetidae sp. FL2044]
MPPNPFMFQKNLPKPGTLPAWRNASSGTLTTLKDILNTCQQGQEDMASRLGVEDKSAEDDVDQLAANIRAEDSTIATLDKESQRLDETLKSQAERLATTQHDNADYDKDRALEMSPSAKDLLKFYLRLFNDFKFLRGLSHEHKVELFSCENELAQHRIAKLEAEVATLKEHAVDTDASAHIDKAVHDEVQAALNEALGKNQELKNELDKVVKQGEEKARDAKMALKAEQNASSAAKDAAKAAEASRKMHEVSNRQLVARRDSLQREVDALKVESSNRDAANQVLTQRLDALANQHSSQLGHRDAENEKTRLEADLQEKGEQMEQLSREHAQEAEKLRSEILSLREKAKETAANTESAMNGVQAMADEYRQEVSSLNDELMLCEGRHREQDAEQQQRILDLEGEVIVAQSIQGDKSREIAQVRHDMSELQTQVEAASAVAKADKIRIDDLVKELDSMTLAKQTAERSVADGKSTLAARATTISELEQKIAGQEEHLHKFHLNLAYYLASETWPPMPESSRDVWDALVTSIGQSERKAPLATRETPAKNMPGSWIMAQPWLVDSEHQEYGAGNGVGMMHLLAQLYGRVTLGIVDGATFRLLELLTRESRLPDQGIFDQAIRLLFAKVLEKMPPSASSDTELLCLGFLQLALLVQDRWDMTISEVDEMYTACTQCPTYGELCQLMCKRHGPSVRKFVEDKGILHGDLGLVSFQDIVLVIRFDDCVVRMVDQRRACFADDSHGMFKAPEGHDNIVVEILSGPELGWWFDMKSS